jgi:hypothetical protein
MLTSIVERKESVMNRRVWTGAVAGVLAAMVVLAVGVGAYRAGQDHEVVTRTVGDGQVVRVVDHGWGYGPGPGFFLFPVFGILLVVLLVRGFRRGHGWYGPSGPGYGPGPWAHGGPPPAFEEWHRRAHESQPPSTASGIGKTAVEP